MDINYHLLIDLILVSGAISFVLISKGSWRGGGEGALFYQCGYFLKGEESYIR